MNNENVNILTVEDPVEYTLDGINQVQVKEDIGLTFAAALRTFLRQDPDIIMLGEIRDRESAQMAIRAAFDRTPCILNNPHKFSIWDHFTAFGYGYPTIFSLWNIKPLNGTTFSTASLPKM